jgi:EAL domain-containing protein (putative c-di-GMP-specific phosphodiesterase class I)
VTAIISMSRALGLRVVAEGVETQQQADELRWLGAEAAQGYLFSRACAPEDFWPSVARLSIETGAASAGGPVRERGARWDQAR